MKKRNPYYVMSFETELRENNLVALNVIYTRTSRISVAYAIYGCYDNNFYFAYRITRIVRSSATAYIVSVCTFCTRNTLRRRRAIGDDN